MTNSKHTPTPWALDEYKSVVDERGQAVLVNGFSMVMSYGEDQNVAKANAAHIVKCVNMHDELVEVVRAMANFDGRNNNYHLKQMARETLKKAGAL